MQQMPIRFLGLLVIGGAILTLPACHNQQTTSPSSATPHLSKNQELARAVAVQGTSFLLKQPERSIECYKRAIQLEPENREWKSELAFAFYKAHRIAEAIPIWQDVAKGKDGLATQSKHFLTKVGAKQQE